MKVAIDKNSIDKINDFKEFNFIYVFDNSEKLDDLIKTNIRCVNINAISDIFEVIDINLSRFNLNAFKKANVNNKDWKEKPKIKENKFAIIIPNYNNDHGNYKGKTYLQNCIESVLNQTYKNFELIIVDDMSTDTSIKTVDNYVDNRIHLIQNKRKRYNGGSRNVGIDYAKETDADYICFLDSDDWWKHEEVLEHINRKLYDYDMMILGSEMLFERGVGCKTYNKFDTYEDVFFCINKVWCTAWSRVIRTSKIVYFCEDTLMEDRVWSYKQADNLEFEKITNLNEIVYVWNRLNTTNSVSMLRGDFWNASAWCHIGHQLQFMQNMKHKEMKSKLEKRINDCIAKVNRQEYQQY